MPKPRFIRLAALCLLWLAPLLRAAEPIEVAVSTDVNLPPQAAWSRMSDFSVAHLYVPGLTETEIVTRERSGVGASRRVYQEGGDYLEETITHWTPGEGFVLRLHRGDKPMSPFKSAQFRYHMQGQGPASTRVTLAIVLLMPLGSVGEFLGDWLARPALEDELTGVAAGLKHYYETGEPATDADRERLADSVRVLPPSEDGT